MFTNFINDLLTTVLGEFIKFVLKWIVKPVFMFSYEITKATVSFYFYQIGVLLLTLLDFISDLFRMMAGLAPGLYFSNMKNAFTGEEYTGAASGAESDLLFQLITSEQILSIFVAIFTLGIFILIVSTLVMIVKQELNLQKSNNKGAAIKVVLKGAVYMILVPVICIFGVAVAQSLLKLMDAATGGQSNTISGVVFATAAYDAFYDDEDFYYSLFDPYSSAFTGVVNMIIDWLNDDEDKGKVDFSTTVSTEGGKHVIGQDAVTADGKFIRRVVLDAYKGNNNAHKERITAIDASTPYRVYYNSTQVAKDFNGSKINYLTWYFFAMVLIKTYVQALFGLVQRLYKVVMLFLVMPGMIGMMPMDEGTAFSSWRKQFTSEVLGSFGIVIAMNLFMTLADIAPSLTIDYETTNIIQDESGASASYNSMVNKIKEILIDDNMSLNIIAYSDLACMVMHTIFILTGALMINKLSSTISSILGGSDMLGIGSGMMSEFTKTAAPAAKMGAAVVMGGLSATRLMTKPLADRLGKKHAENAEAKFNGTLPSFKSRFKDGVSNVKTSFGNFKDRGFKGNAQIVGGAAKKVATGGVKATKNFGVNAFRKSLTGVKTLGSSITTGAIFSPTAMKTLYRFQNDQDEAKRKLAKANTSKEKSGAKAELEEKKKMLEQAKVGAKSVATANMRMNLEMAKDDILDAMPGMKTLSGLKKDFKKADDDVSGSNSVSKDLKSRIEAMKKDNATKAAEKKHSDILDKLHIIAGADAIRNAIDTINEMWNQQDKDAKEFMSALASARRSYDSALASGTKDALDLAKATYERRKQEIVARARAKGLDVIEKSKSEIDIQPSMNISEINSLKDIANTANSKASFDKQIRSLLNRWSSDMTKDNSEMINALNKALESVMQEMNNKK